MRSLSELDQPATDVAPLLLGSRLSHTTPDGTVTVVLTEVEAYLGAEDPASHAFRGETTRNRSMFSGQGHLYVYRSHGLHWCCNVVTGPEGQPGAVLLRAGRVTEGLPLARARRGEGKPDAALASGPGCLTQALGITGADDGVHLLAGGALRLEPGSGRVPAFVSGPRVGISKAMDQPWRYWVPEDPTVSRHRGRHGDTQG
jgi:DNA-3-methyladenine glycosylase